MTFTPLSPLFVLPVMPAATSSGTQEAAVNNYKYGDRLHGPVPPSLLSGT